jgi:hypothetical protein
MIRRASPLRDDAQPLAHRVGHDRLARVSIQSA